MGRVEKTVDMGFNRQYAVEIAPQSGYVIGKIQGMGARENQEDAFGLSETDLDYIKKKGYLVVVADGMGGMQDGEKASVAAVISCLETFSTTGMKDNRQEYLCEMIEDANLSVLKALGEGSKKGGCTLLIAYIFQDEVVWATVGDSRIYLYEESEKRLSQINEEHNYGKSLSRMVEQGEISKAVAISHPQRKALTSFLGAKAVKEIDTGTIKLQKGDKVALMTDGVFGTLESSELERIMQFNADKTVRNIEFLINSKKKHNQDNYTAIIIEKL